MNDPTRELYRQVRVALDPVELAREVMPDRVLDQWQVDLLRSRHKRKLVMCSRQLGKTDTTALKVLHTAMFHPNRTTLIVSPGERQSLEAFDKVREHLANLDWPMMDESDESNKSCFRLQNGHRVKALPGGKPKTLRGFSNPRLVICDEAAMCDEGLLAALVPMFMSSDSGELIMMSTPNGKRGFFYEGWENGGDVYERTKALSVDIPRIPAVRIEEQRRILGEWQFRQEIMCEFLENSHAFFRDEDIRAAIVNDVKTLDW